MVRHFSELQVNFLRVSRKRQDGFAPNIFLGFKRKHLFITTCIEKHCIRPLKTNFRYWYYRCERSRNKTASEVTILLLLKIFA